MITRLIGMDELHAQKGISYSKSQLFRKIKSNTFPRPIRLGDNRIAFVESEIDAWIEARISERDAQQVAS